MIKKYEKTNYFFLLKYLTAVAAIATITIAATTLKYSATALIIPPIIVSSFIQPLIIAAVTLALIAYTMSFLFCNNNNTRIYSIPSYNTIPLFRVNYHGGSTHNHVGSTHNHGGSTHDHGNSTHDYSTQRSVHGHR